VIKEGKTPVLLANLMMAAFQKRMGDKLGVQPGAEMVKAIQITEEVGAKTVLADRDVTITLKRTWGKLSFWEKIKLFGQLMLAIYDKKPIVKAIQDLGKGATPEAIRFIVIQHLLKQSEKLEQAEVNRLVDAIMDASVPGLRVTGDMRRIFIDSVRGAAAIDEKTVKAALAYTIIIRSETTPGEAIAYLVTLGYNKLRSVPADRQAAVFDWMKKAAIEKETFAKVVSVFDDLVIAAILTNSVLKGEDIALLAHRLDAERRRCPDHMLVIGVDAPQPMLAGASEMQCIGRADRDAFAQRPQRFRSIHDQVICDRKPSPQPGRAIVAKLCRDFAKLALRKSAFAPLAMKNTRRLDPPERAAMHASQRFRQTPDSIAFQLIDVELGNVRGVEVAHFRSRSSETDCVLSVPPLSEPSMRV